MTSRLDAIQEVITSARGARPQSLACREAEEVLNISLASLIELAVANDRIDRLERMVADLSGQSVEALRETTFEGDVERERQQSTEALLMRALRIFIDNREWVSPAAP